jgi:hypothetical protein
MKFREQRDSIAAAFRVAEKCKGTPNLTALHPATFHLHRPHARQRISSTDVPVAGWEATAGSCCSRSVCISGVRTQHYHFHESISSWPCQSCSTLNSSKTCGFTTPHACWRRWTKPGRLAWKHFPRVYARPLSSWKYKIGSRYGVMESVQLLFSIPLWNMGSYVSTGNALAGLGDDGKHAL